MSIRTLPTIVPAYRYKATITRAVDGDTVAADVSLGFGVALKDQLLRLAGCNAPELDPKELKQGWTKEQVDAWMALPGRKSQDMLRRILFNASSMVYDEAYSMDSKAEVIIETTKNQNDKYGRLLASIWVKRPCEWCKGTCKIPVAGTKRKVKCTCCEKGLYYLNVNDWMIENGYAKPWDGSGAKPV